MGGTRGTRALALALVLLAVSSSCASAKSATAPSAVHLTSDGADAEIGKMTDDAEFAAIEFFAPWCPHCQNFGPTWETVAAYFNKGEGNAGVRPTPRVTVFSVDCVAERDMCHEFHITGYPTVFFGTLKQFKAEKEKENAGKLAKLSARSAKDMLALIGTETGGSYSLREESLEDTAEARATRARAEVAAAALKKTKQAFDGTEEDNSSAPHADLLDVAVATSRAYHEMTSPALLRPETRHAFLGFLNLLKAAHPLRVCADGARAIVDAFDDLWPAEDGDIAGVRARLSSARVCGDGLERLLLGISPDAQTRTDKQNGSGLSPDPDAAVRDTPWRSCLGTVEGTRGYTCGLWTLFHALAARAPGEDGGAVWFDAIVGWIEHFFPCDDCRSHFLAMAGEVESGDVVTARDAQLWAWKAHNKVNARLAEREANGLGAGSGDPAFPKTQWPDASACEACRAPITGAGARGEKKIVRWDEEAVAAFLTVYFHGVGAPRLELGDGKSALGAPKDDGVLRAKKESGKTGSSRPAKAFFFLAFAALAAYGVKTNRLFLSSGNARRVLLLIRGGKSSVGGK
jgi:thiol oxidase